MTRKKNQNIDILQSQCIEKGILKNPFLSFTLICRTRKEITVKEPYLFVFVENSYKCFFLLMIFKI